MDRLYQYLIGIASFLFMSCVSATTQQVTFQSNGPSPAVAGYLIIDLVDGDGLYGSRATLGGLADLTVNTSGSVQALGSGTYLLTDEFVVSSATIYLENIRAGFSVTVDTAWMPLGPSGFPDALVFGFYDGSGNALWTTADPRGANSALILSSTGNEIYAPSGMNVTVGASAVPETSQILMLSAGLVLIAMRRRHWRCMLPALVIGMAAAPASATMQDVSAQVTVTRGPLVLNRASKTFDGLVTVRNTGATSLYAPIFLELSAMPDTVSVNSATNISVNGKPMVRLPITGPLAPGQSVNNFVVRFHNPGQLKFTPVMRVFANSDDSLPPDPGDAGKTTIAGIDANNNAVRDDVEIYIATNFNTSERLVKALNDYAVANQRGLLASNEQQSMQAASLLTQAMECLAYINLEDASWKSVSAIVVNTPERFEAWRAHERRLSGKVFPGRPMKQWKESCTFQPDELRN